MSLFFDTSIYPKKEYDYDTNGNLIYEGFGNPTANIDDPAWLILKHSYDSNNNRISTKLSNNEAKYNKKWVNRNIYNYTNSLNNKISNNNNNQAPIIDSLVWDNDNHNAANNYILTISAHDPDTTDTITYNITCDDTNVNIVQDTNNDNIFTITYPNYSIDTNVTYTITATDNYGASDSTITTKLIANNNQAPIIDNIVWDDDNHIENNSYTLTIDAHDPDINDSISSYSVTCNDTNVSIVQDTTNDNIFTITYPSYPSDTNVTYTITVTDNYGIFTISNISKLVEHIIPIGDKGVFSGGINSNNSYLNNIDYITISTLSNAQDFGDLLIGRWGLAATSNGNNDRGVFGNGYNGNNLNIIDYITISISGNAQDFGDLINSINSLTATSNDANNRGIFGGGYKSNIVDYITISTLGNAQDFGDLTTTRNALAATSNSTNERGVFGGGYDFYFKSINTIDYITISTLSNAQDFGNLTGEKAGLTATSNGINNRGIFGGGADTNSYRYNTIDYITISTLGNAQDFGDLTITRNALAATSNSTNERGVFGGGYNVNNIDYITISTLGNAQDFGDLTITKYNLSATSNT